MIDYWLNQLKLYGETIDNDPTEYFIPLANYLDVITLLVNKGYFTLDNVMDYELQVIDSLGYDHMRQARSTMSFSDMLDFIGFKGTGDWETYPSLMWAAEYLASDIASPLDRVFFANASIWASM